MESQIFERLNTTYAPLVSQFVKSLKKSKEHYSGCPNIFFPTCGKYYTSSKYKIAFVGWETRDTDDLLGQLHAYDKGIENLLFNYKYTSRNFIETLSYVQECNNSGKTFWDFNLRFLGAFYRLNNWKELKGDSNNEYDVILKSFAWGNCDSIERYEMCAGDIDWEDWNEVKQASHIFDDAKHFIHTFRPNVLIVTQFAETRGGYSWLSRSIDSVPHKLADYTEYGFLKDSNTHVFWTYHPTYLRKVGADFDKIIRSMVDKLSDLGISVEATTT